MIFCDLKKKFMCDIYSFAILWVEIGLNKTLSGDILNKSIIQ